MNAQYWLIRTVGGKAYVAYATDSAIAISILLRRQIIVAREDVSECKPIGLPEVMVLAE